MSPHTPGPWRAVKGKGLVSVYGPDCRIYSAALDPKNLAETHARQWADARLIAAAPALLEALEKAALQDHHPACLVVRAMRTPSSCDCFVGAARAALALARPTQDSLGATPRRREEKETP